MKVILSSIEKAKGTRYNIFVDDEYWYNVDLETVLQKQLKVGMIVDDEFLEAVMDSAGRRKARERGYYLLGYRDHSKLELYKKLCECASERIAMEVVEMLEEQGLVNDAEYANKLARHCLVTKRWGARRASMEMQRKGLDKSVIADALEAIEVDPVEKITELIDKKYFDELDDYKQRQKVIASLLRLGFYYDDIKTAINGYNLIED